MNSAENKGSPRNPPAEQVGGVGTHSAPAEWEGGTESPPTWSSLSPDAQGLVTGVVQDRAGNVRMVAWLSEASYERTLETGLVTFWSRSRERLWTKGEESGNTLRLLDVQADCDGDTLLLTVDPAGPTCHTGSDTCFGEAGGAVSSEIPPKGGWAPPAEGRWEGGTEPPAEKSPNPLAEQVGGVGPRSASAEWEGGTELPVERSPNPPAEQVGGVGPRSAPAEWEGGAEPSAQSRFAFLDTLWATIESRAANRPEGSYTTQLLDAGPDLAARKVVEEATEVLIAAKNHAASIDDDQRLAEEAADLVYHVLVTLAERGVDPSLVTAELARRHA